MAIKNACIGAHDVYDIATFQRLANFSKKVTINFTRLVGNKTLMKRVIVFKIFSFIFVQHNSL